MINHKAKRMFDGVWVYGFVLQLQRGETYIITPRLDSQIDTIYLDSHRVIPETVCEDCGVADTTNQVIYTHDILEYKMDVEEPIQLYVVGQEGCKTLVFSDCAYSKVVGNIKNDIVRPFLRKTHL